MFQLMKTVSLIPHTTCLGFNSQWLRYTFYRASHWLPLYLHNKVERLLVCAEGWRRISRLDLTKDIKMSSCVFQCNVPHQWIAPRQVGRVSVYCDWEGCHALSLPHGISVWQHIGQDVCSMTFLCSSTLVKVLLLQVGTVEILPNVYKQR